MKLSFKSQLLLMVIVSTSVVASEEIPVGSLGVVVAEKMAQGQLLWLKGRVGNATYSHLTQDGSTCSVELPVAVGGISDSGLGIDETKGLEIYVMSERLNRAILQGERINSENWHFSSNSKDTDLDGYIRRGIAADEGFILNSKRRWISWFMEEGKKLGCI